jgi:hypothetical protein
MVSVLVEIWLQKLHTGQNGATTLSRAKVSLVDLAQILGSAVTKTVYPETNTIQTTQATLDVVLMRTAAMAGTIDVLRNGRMRSHGNGGATTGIWAVIGITGKMAVTFTLVVEPAGTIRTTMAIDNIADTLLKTMLEVNAHFVAITIASLEMGGEVNMEIMTTKTVARWTGLLAPQHLVL